MDYDTFLDEICYLDLLEKNNGNGINDENPARSYYPT